MRSSCGSYFIHKNPGLWRRSTALTRTTGTFIARKSDLDDRLYKMYDKIEEVENELMDARAKKQAIEADKITGGNIYKILICFDKLYATMTEAERRQTGGDFDR
ncbi:MAG: hypothetical protein ACLRRU_00420 [Faecalibacterium sp.]